MLNCMLCPLLCHCYLIPMGYVTRAEKSDAAVVEKKPYQFVNIWTLREYLEYELRIPNPPFDIDFERIVDDFVFMCFFVGNDFLPHMPTLEIRERAINLLMAIYKKEFRSLGGYLTDASKPDLGRLEHFIQAVGSCEVMIFQKRARLHQRQAERIKCEKGQTRKGDDAEPQVHENKELKTKLKELLREKSDMFNSKHPEEDKIKLGEPGWRERYYEEKFSAKTIEELDEIRRDVVLRYTEGLCWVMHYCYEGVCSWRWFYPYHYAPFASDLKDLGQLDISFELGSPFKPFNQLLGVFPAASAHALPKSYRKLMTDASSPIIDFYPADFEVDMNGKRYTWQGIAKLPFIDEVRLLSEVKKIEHTLTEEEARRNSMSFDMVFVLSSHSLSESMYQLDNRCKQLPDKERMETKEPINPGLSDGMNGYLSSCAGDIHPPIFRSPVPGMEDIMNNEVICAIFRLPDSHKHITQPPAGVIFPKKLVNASDVKPEPVLWHEDYGRRPWDNQRQNPPVAESGRQLGEASLRMVMNSLQIKPSYSGYSNHMHAQLHVMPALMPLLPHSNGVRDPGHSRMAHPGLGYSQTSHQRPLSSTPYYYLGNGYGQPYAKPAYSYHPHRSREDRSHQRSTYQPAEFNMNYGQTFHPGGYAAQLPTTGAAYIYQGGYDMYDGCQSSSGNYQQFGSSFLPPTHHNFPGGHYNHGRGNQFSALDMRANRMPPNHSGRYQRPPGQRSHPQSSGHSCQ